MFVKGILLIFSVLILTTKASSICINPNEFVKEERVDITAKYAYAWAKFNNINCIFFNNLYLRHIELINNFFEEAPLKKTSLDFTNSFDSLITSVSKEGFNKETPIPIRNAVGQFIDGAHRISICIAAQKLIHATTNFKEIKNLSPIHKNIVNDYRNTPYDKKIFKLYDFEYFKIKGMEEAYLDYMALTYIRLNKNCSFLFVYPAGEGKEQNIQEEIKKHGQLIYRKELFLKNNGPLLFALQVYEYEPYIGSISNNFKGARHKVSECFINSKNPLRVYLIECESLEKTKELKKELRTMFKDHNAIHTNDTHDEAINIAKIVFVQNSINFLNTAKYKFFSNFNEFFYKFKNWVKNKESEFFCIDGSAVLSAYGIRDCNDLDILHHKYDSEINELKSEKIESQNKEIKFHNKNISDIIFDPKNHFYFKGIKFTALNLVENFKRNRSSKPNDIVDISLIKSLYSNNYSQL